MKKSQNLKVISILLCVLLIFQQTGFAQVVSVELNIAGHFASLANTLSPDKFRPLHLRSISFNGLSNNFKLLLDKGDTKNPKTQDIESTAKDLLNYFFVGISLSNDTFWVNLRPDSPNDIIDPLLAQTQVGKILLEADLQLKKDTANATNPGTPEGKKYWNKLYQKAQELYGNQNVTIPTLTRPWIVPDEIIIRESPDSAYVYKATLKVMLEQDYLKGSAIYSFKDEREKQLNEYSSQIIREEIIPGLIKEINNAKRYAPLRQVYYSLILAQWFKARHRGLSSKGAVLGLIDRKDLTNLQSRTPYSVATYFDAYQENFAKGEYNIQEPIYTPYGQVIRSYFSGGITNIAPVVPAFGQPTFVDSKTGTKITVAPADKELMNPNKNNLYGEVVLTVLAELNKLEQNSSSPVAGEIKRWFTIGGLTASMAITLQSNNLSAQGSKDAVGIFADTTEQDLKTSTPEKLKDLVNGGNWEAAYALDTLASSGNAVAVAAKKALKTSNPEKLIELAVEGEKNAVFALEILAYYDNVAAEEALKTLSLGKLIALAVLEGDKNAVDILRILALRGNVAAQQVLKTLSPGKFIELAVRGNRDAVGALLTLASYGNVAAQEALKTLNPGKLIELAVGGDKGAMSVLRSLVSYSNAAANEGLRTLSPEESTKIVIGGSGDAPLVLRILLAYGNTVAIPGLLNPASQYRADAIDVLKKLSNEMALVLREAYLKEHFSNQVLENMLREQTLNNSQLFYCIFTSPENFGDLAKIIFKHLNSQAENEHIDLVTYLKKIDPQRFFYKDFMLQAANFSLLDDMLITPGALQGALNDLFVGLTKDEAMSYSMRLALFVEAVVNDKNFSLQKEFQTNIRQLYDQTQGASQYLISGLLYLYRDKLIYLNPEDILKISKKQNIFYTPDPVNYAKIMKDGRIVTHIIFADEAAVSGHYEPTAKFFQEKGFKRFTSKPSEITLKKGIIEIHLFKAADGNYDIENHMQVAGIIRSSSHAGIEERVFNPQDTLSAYDYQGIIFPSACRSVTVLPDILQFYPKAKGIGVNSTAYGEVSNIVTFYFLEGLAQRIKTYPEIKDFIRPHLEDGVKNYTFPGEPAFVLYELMYKYNQATGASSSPVGETGQIGNTPFIIESSYKLLPEVFNFIQELTGNLYSHLPEPARKKLKEKVERIRLGKTPLYMEDELGTYVEEEKTIYFADALISSRNPGLIAEIFFHEFGHPLLNGYFPELDSQISADFLALYALGNSKLQVLGDRNAHEQYDEYRERLEQFLGVSAEFTPKIKKMALETEESWYAKLNKELGLPRSISREYVGGDVYSFASGLIDKLIDSYNNEKNPVMKEGILLQLKNIEEVLRTPLKELSGFAPTYFPRELAEIIEREYNVFIGTGHYTTPENNLSYSLIEIKNNNLQVEVKGKRTYIMDTSNWKLFRLPLIINNIIAVLDWYKQNGAKPKESIDRFLAEEVASSFGMGEEEKALFLNVIFDIEGKTLISNIEKYRQDFEKNTIALSALLKEKNRILNDNIRSFNLEENLAVNNVFTRIERLSSPLNNSVSSAVKEIEKIGKPSVTSSPIPAALETIDNAIAILETRLNATSLKRMPRLGFHIEESGHQPVGNFWYYIFDSNSEYYKGVEKLEFLERLQGAVIRMLNFIPQGNLPEIYVLKDAKERSLIVTDTKPQNDKVASFYPLGNRVSHRYFFTEGSNYWPTISPELIVRPTITLTTQEYVDAQNWGNYQASVQALKDPDSLLAKAYLSRLLYKKTLEVVLSLSKADTELKGQSVSSPVNKTALADKKGGIDFRFLPIVTQSMDNLKLSLRSMPVSNLQRIDLTQEWSDIERLVNSGITPSAERLKDYFAASCFKGNLESDMEKIVSCISDILRMEEESCSLTDPALKNILVVLGSGRSGQELKLAFMN
jgi:hypothetical protein